MNNLSHNNASSIKNETCELTTEEIFYITVHCLIILAGIIGNCLVIAIFYPFKKHKQKSYSLLIWYLSLFDLLASLVLIPEVYESATCYRNWLFGWFGCKMLYPCYYISINISVCILIIMTIDRYRNIVTPFKKKLKLQAVHGGVFASVIISFILQWYQFNALYIHEVSETTTHCYQKKSLITYTIPRAAKLCFRDIIFIALFSITTIRINNTLVIRKRRMSSHDATTNLKHQKALNMLFILGLTFAILVVPYDSWDCAMLISRVLPPSYHIQMSESLSHLDLILTTLQMMSNVVNCLIYAKMHNHFKKKLRKFWKDANNIELIPLTTYNNTNYQSSTLVKNGLSRSMKTTAV